MTKRGVGADRQAVSADDSRRRNRRSFVSSDAGSFSAAVYSEDLLHGNAAYAWRG